MSDNADRSKHAGGILILSPTTAARLAEDSVEFVQKRFGFALPYTPESLILVDAIVAKIKETGATQQQASGLLSGLGCYAGEVFVRHAKASWRLTAEMGLTRSCRFPVVLALPGAGVVGCDVLGRVFQSFSGASVEGVARLYETVLAPPVVDGSVESHPPAGEAPATVAPTREPDQSR